MSSFKRVLFLGIDAGDKDLIKSWARDGTLPTFRTLLANGLVGDTESLEGFYVGATWPSFMTGVSPAKHGIHSLVQLNPGTYDLYRVKTGETMKRRPFWEYLSSAGRRVAVFDVPLAGVSRGLNGLQMVEWGVHDGIYGFSTWPPNLRRRVLSRFGRHPLTRPCDSYGIELNEYEVFRNLLVKGVYRKARLTKHYLMQSRWDFFGQVFSESHCVGHQCWHLHDPSHPSYDADTVAIVGDPMRDVYVAIDTALGEILAQVQDDTIVLILASHRMAHYFGMPFLLPDILCRLRVALPLRLVEKRATPPSLVGQVENVLSWGWHHTPAGIKDKLGWMRTHMHRWLARCQGQTSPRFFGVDPRESDCFILFNGSAVSGLRLNVRGREPEGRIQPGADMAAFCNRLASDLLQIVAVETGKPVIRSVKQTADLYRGEHLHHLPDLLIEWNDEQRFGSTVLRNPYGSRVRVTSEKIGVLEGVNTYCRTGDHRPEGLFIALGPGIKPGALRQRVSILEFAPTITRLLGVELPNQDIEPVAGILGDALGLAGS
jgi:predicted AlkP superfamily phosphohydrolase/phosphomutase